MEVVGCVLNCYIYKTQIAIISFMQCKMPIIDVPCFVWYSANMICMLVLQNCMDVVEGESGNCSGTDLTCDDDDGTELVSITVEDAIDIKEEFSIKTEDAIDMKEEFSIKVEDEIKKYNSRWEVWVHLGLLLMTWRQCRVCS